jgi:hypothetical protein
VVSRLRQNVKDHSDATALFSLLEVIRDKKTGESLQYAFIEFDKQEDVRFQTTHTRTHADDV